MPQDKTPIAYFSHSGNTRELAEEVAALTGGRALRHRRGQEVSAGLRFGRSYREEGARGQGQAEALAEGADMAAYGTVFVGYPDWWSTMPMAVFTFLEQYDFSGKKIIPFCTHEGSGLGRSEADLAALCPNSTLLAGLAVRGSKAKGARKEVAAWLSSLSLGR